MNKHNASSHFTYFVINFQLTFSKRNLIINKLKRSCAKIAPNKYSVYIGNHWSDDFRLATGYYKLFWSMPVVNIYINFPNRRRQTQCRMSCIALRAYRGMEYITAFIYYLFCVYTEYSPIGVFLVTFFSMTIGFLDTSVQI